MSSIQALSQAVVTACNNAMPVINNAHVGDEEARNLFYQVEASYRQFTEAVSRYRVYNGTSGHTWTSERKLQFRQISQTESTYLKLQNQFRIKVLGGGDGKPAVDLKAKEDLAYHYRTGQSLNTNYRGGVG